MNASLREIVLAVRFGEASLVGESVGYLVLGACDRAVSVPRTVDLDGVLVTSEGEVVLDASPATEEEAERSLRHLLGQLLTLLRAPFPNLARVAVREPCGLRHLVSELEAALVPVNRRAARRSLSRLVREARRSSTRERAALAVTELDLLPQPTVPAPPDDGVRQSLSPAPERLPAQRDAVTLAPLAPEPEAPEGGVDEVPSLLFEPVTRVPERVLAQPETPTAGFEPLSPTTETEPFVRPAESEAAPSTWGEAPAQSGEVLLWGAESRDELDDALDQAFDQALTRVASAVETLPPPEARPRPSFNLRRLTAAPEVEGPLLSTMAPQALRPSSIEDLLQRMRIEGEPTEVVLAGLAALARIDLSPPAPPVG